MVNWQEPGMSMNMAQSIVDQMGGTGAAGVGKMSVQEHGSVHC